MSLGLYLYTNLIYKIIYFSDILPPGHSPPINGKAVSLNLMQHGLKQVSIYRANCELKLHMPIHKGKINCVFEERQLDNTSGAIPLLPMCSFQQYRELLHRLLALQRRGGGL